MFDGKRSDRFERLQIVGGTGGIARTVNKDRLSSLRLSLLQPDPVPCRSFVSGVVSMTRGTAPASLICSG